MNNLKENIKFYFCLMLTITHDFKKIIQVANVLCAINFNIEKKKVVKLKQLNSNDALLSFVLFQKVNITDDFKKIIIKTLL